jgi:hypothetical protein
MNPKTHAKLAAAMSEVTAKDLEGTGPKTEFLQFRVSRLEKEGIQSTATALGLQVSEYLLRLHELAAARLKK